MAPDPMDIDQPDTVQDGGQEKIEAPSASVVTSSVSQLHAPQVQAQAPTPAVARYKYKYPEAYPTPSGEDNEVWNKIYTAADSRMYNKHGKTATESKKRRTSGETYQLALRMLQEKKDKAALTGSGSAASTKAATPKSAPKPTTKKPSTSTMKAPSASSGDATPSTDMTSTLSISEMIKSEGRARKATSAALSDHGTPAPSTVPAVMGNPAHLSPPAHNMEKPKKKGTAALVKNSGTKRKHDDSADTPTSSTRADGAGLSPEEDSNDGLVYCICRGPDDHRMMVRCDGGCEEWYHCACIGIDIADAKNLLDKFICEKCRTDKQYTTWRRLCRYNCVGESLDEPNPCRKAARVMAVAASKFCSDEHREAYWKWTASGLARGNDEPARGGPLSAGEVGWLLARGLTSDQLHTLGGKPTLLVEEVADSDHPPGLNFLTEDEQRELQKITKRQSHLEVELQLHKDKERFRVMCTFRAEQAFEYQGMRSLSEMCGYDSRLAFNEIEFAVWLRCAEGLEAFETGWLSSRSAERGNVAAFVPTAGHLVEDPNVPEFLKSMCLKKKCGKHISWPQRCRDKITFECNLLLQEQKMLAERKAEIIHDAETTQAMRAEYAQSLAKERLANGVS